MDGCEGVKLRGGYGYGEPISQNPSGVCHSRSRGLSLGRHNLSSICATKSIADCGEKVARTSPEIHCDLYAEGSGEHTHLGRGPLPSAVE